jgi:hypothetical protein
LTAWDGTIAGSTAATGSGLGFGIGVHNQVPGIAAVTIDNFDYLGNTAGADLAQIDVETTWLNMLVRYGDVQGGLAGVGNDQVSPPPIPRLVWLNNLDVDPEFVDAPAGDYHVSHSAGDTVADAGSDGIVPSDFADLDGGCFTDGSNGQTAEQTPPSADRKPRFRSSIPGVGVGMGRSSCRDSVPATAPMVTAASTLPTCWRCSAAGAVPGRVTSRTSSAST